MSSDYDSHVYLIDGGTELALVDAGSGLSFDAMLASIEATGYSLDRLRHLFLTHKHADHAGGAFALGSGRSVTVHASAETAEAIADESGYNTRLARARRVGTYPSDYRFRSAHVGHILTDGEKTPVGDLIVESVASPGHCDGHYCYLMSHEDRRYLFAGDAIVADGLFLLQAIPDCSVTASIATIERLATLDVDVLLPGHFLPRLAHGRDDIEKAMERIRAGLAPVSAI